MTLEIVGMIIDFQFEFWLGALPLLFGLWLLKRWIYD